MCFHYIHQLKKKKSFHYRGIRIPPKYCILYNFCPNCSDSDENELNWPLRSTVATLSPKIRAPPLPPTCSVAIFFFLALECTSKRPQTQDLFSTGIIFKQVQAEANQRLGRAQRPQDQRQRLVPGAVAQRIPLRRVFHHSASTASAAVECPLLPESEDGKLWRGAWQAVQQVPVERQETRRRRV